MKLKEIVECPLIITETDGVLEITIEEKVMRRVGKMMANHPTAVGLAGLWAASALSTYKKNKRYTTRFFAKSAEERKLYDRIVKDLMATGSYKLIRTKYVDGGKLWELARRNV